MLPDYIPEPDYRAAPGLNWSQLKHIARSPRDYAFQLDAPNTPTAAMRLGSAVHAAILEPERYAAEWTVYSGRRAGKAWLDFANANADKHILSDKEADDVTVMAEHCRAHPDCARRLSSGWAERSVFWQEDVVGFDEPVAMKARLDWVYEDDGGFVLVDLKTSRDVAPRPFGTTAGKLMYHGQIAHYLNALQSVVGDAPVRAEIMVVESGRPWNAGVYMIDDTAIECGLLRRRQMLERLAECTRRDEWPGLLPEPQWLELPEWELAVLDDADVVGG